MNYKKIYTNNRQLLICTALLVIIGAALCIRFENMRNWQNHPETFFAQGQPLLINLDGYYYLGLAQDLLDNTYTPIDEFRAVPESPDRPTPPPLLSMLLALLAKTGVSLNWLGVTLPVVLSILLCVPVFLFSKQWGRPIMTITACAMVLLSPYYILRTKTGVLDTDCLNVTLAMMCAYWALLFGTHQGRKKIIALICTLVFYLIFLWWWDQTPTAVTLFGLLPLAIASLVFFRGSKRQAFFLVTGILVITIAGASFIFGPDFPSIVFSKIQATFSYISKQETDLYQNIGTTIGEQAKPSFLAFAEMTTFHPVLFALAVAGWLWLIAKHRKETLVLLPLGAIGLFGYFYAVRFTLFLIPILGLGLGFLLSECSKRKPLALPAYILSAGVICYSLFTNIHNKPLDIPVFQGQTVQGMQLLKSTTPNDAVIWSWWNEGHPLVYWGRRSTITDGMIHGGERSYWNSVVLSATNYRFAANLMQFIQTRGIQGVHLFTRALPDKQDLNNTFLKKILAAGPRKARAILHDNPLALTEHFPTINDWLTFLFPEHPRPIYLFLDEYLLESHLWTYWFGTWDVTAHKGDKTLLTFSFPYKQKGENIITSPSGAEFDISAGTATLHRYFNETVPIFQTVRSEKTGSQFMAYKENQGQIQLTYKKRFAVPGILRPMTITTGRYQLEINTSAQHAVFQDYKKSQTITNRLFWRMNDFDPKYFTPIALATPKYQIWKIQGDLNP